jgi:MFS family permease
VNTDITDLARSVRQIDFSVTLKAFTAVLAPLAVLWNIHAIYEAVEFVVMEVQTEGDIDENFWMAVAIVIASLSAILSPFAFILLDWARRKQRWRYVSVVYGAALGALAFALIGLGIGVLTTAIWENEAGAYDRRLRVALFIATLVVALMVLALARMAPGRNRNRVLWTGAGLGLVVAMAYPVQVTITQEWERSELLLFYSNWFGWLVLACWMPWWLVRAIRIRLTMSSPIPRSLFLGQFVDGSFWFRMAYLVGLPSSLWSLRAARTAAFWAFLVARPLVFLGFAAIFSDLLASLGQVAASIIGGTLVLAGHFLFYFGKRLAAQYIEDPRKTRDLPAPILFLRSFDDDQMQFKTSPWNLFRRWLNLWSFRRNVDELLVDEMAQYAPVIALGEPGEKRIPFGAMRYYAEHANWKEIVTETAKRATAIVIVAGDSSSVLWELKLLKSEGLLGRTLLLFRPEGNDSVNRKALIELLGEAASKALVLPVHSSKSIALLRPNREPELLVSSKPFAQAYLIALRMHFQRLVCGDTLNNSEAASGGRKLAAKNAV